MNNDRAVTDEAEDTNKNHSTNGAPAAGDNPRDPRDFQRNLAERLFPGPSPMRSSRTAQHIQGLLRPLDDGTAANGWRERRGKTPPAGPAPEDTAQMQAKLDEQNELLRAILASTVDTQEDARSTAQNSRTFAWAGTAIALLTLIATVISVVAAVQGH
jgi:hypothetical protein